MISIVATDFKSRIPYASCVSASAEDGPHNLVNGARCSLTRAALGRGRLRRYRAPGGGGWKSTPSYDQPVRRCRSRQIEPLSVKSAFDDVDHRSGLNDSKSHCRLTRYRRASCPAPARHTRIVAIGRGAAAAATAAGLVARVAGPYGGGRSFTPPYRLLTGTGRAGRTPVVQVPPPLSRPTLLPPGSPPSPRSRN